MENGQPGKRRRIWNFVIGLVAGVLLAATIPVGFGQTAKKVENSTSEELAQANELRDREKLVATKEKELAEKEEELKARQQEVDAKLATLLATQNDLKAKLNELQVVKDKQFRDLMKIYAAMSPSKVAPLLNQMEDSEALEVLKGLKTDQVAKIMPKLEQEKAVRLSRMFGLLQ
jgi:flagellar motility protein MotE (MotC chaperone)